MVGFMGVTVLFTKLQPKNILSQNFCALLYLSHFFWNKYSSAHQQPEFLKKFPEFDGRNVLIAIIDGSVDVSLEGLQTTTTGLPKIVDCIDFTGHGNIDTSVIRKANKNDILLGLTGRKLKIPSTWKNPNQEWHLGVKDGGDLCTNQEALDRITKQRKSKISNANKALLKKVREANFKQKKKDFEFLQKYFKAAEEHLSKASGIMDCIVWHDGERWQACIDTSCRRDLESQKVMSNFRDSHEFGLIFSIISYSFSIQNDGNILQICYPFDDHGTVVAQIASAHFPGDNLDKNNNNFEIDDGLAPGAQIVVFNTLDPKNDHLANGRVLENAIQKCIDLKVDIINLSTGIPEHLYPLLKEMSEIHGIIIVNSIGNDGPVYSSIAEDEEFSFPSLIFRIGSNSQNYIISSSFSSRGPTTNGEIGVNFVAPGSAKTAQPRFYAEKFIDDENEEEKLSQGHGIIQILSAFEFYQKFLGNFPSEIQNISVQLKTGENGIVIKCHGKYEFEAKIKIISTEGTLKIPWKLTLSKNAEKFVKFFALNSDASFTISIDTKNLHSNSINFGEIFGLDSSNPQWGPLFHFPITIFLPITIKEGTPLCKIISVTPKVPHHLFLKPPPESLQCLITVSSTTPNTKTVFLQSAATEWDFPEEIKISKFSPPQTVCFNVEFYDSQEICIFQCETESDFVATELKIEIKFFGIKINHGILGKLPNRINLLNLGPSVSASEISVNFDRVTYILWADKIEMEPQKGDSKKVFFKVFYNLAVKIRAKCFFKLLIKDCAIFKFSQSLGFSILTRTNKCIHHYLNNTTEGLILVPDTYLLVGRFEYQEQCLFQKYLPFMIGLPFFKITMQFKSSTKQMLYKSGGKKIIISKNDEILVDENQSALFYYKTPIFDLPLPWRPTSYVDGIVKFKFHGMAHEFPIKYIRCPLKEAAHEIYDLTKDLIQSWILPNNAEIKNILNNITNIREWQNAIKTEYLNQSYSNLIRAVDGFLEAVNSKNFLKNFNAVFGETKNLHEQKMLLERKNAIVEALFFKADLSLDIFISSSVSIPSKIKEKLLNFSSMLFQSTSTSNGIPQSSTTFLDYCKNSISHFLIPYSENNDKRNAIPLQNGANFKFCKNIDFETVSKFCDQFFSSLPEDNSIQKSIIIIKSAIIVQNFGTALFFLNKLSTKNETNPAFKIVDETIIELLKFLQWHHLVEAHENALLDKYPELLA